MTRAIVLAGGASSRFGGDKLAAVVGGRPLLQYALEAVGEVADTIVIVVAPDAPEPGPPASVAGRVVVARDAVAYRGPLAGLTAGLAALAVVPARESGTRDAADDVALVVGGDMPHLMPSVLRLLADALAADAALGAVTLEADPQCALPMAVRPAVAALAAQTLLDADRRALRGLIDRLASDVVPAAAWRALDPDGLTLVDVDTPADLGPADRGR